MTRLRRDEGSTRLVMIIAVLVVIGLGAFAVARKMGGGNVDVEDALKRGDVEAAVRGLDRILRESPGDEQALYYRGICQIELRNVEQGLRDLATLGGSPRYRDLAWRAQIQAYLDTNRIAEARTEVENPPAWVSGTALGHEAMGLYHEERAQDAIEQAVKRIGEAKGDRRGEQARGMLTRLVHADSKIYAQSLDNVLEVLAERYEFQEGAQLSTVIDRGHRHLLAAVAEFGRAIELSARPDQDPVPNSRWELSEIMVVRDRMAEAEANWAALARLDVDRLARDLLRQTRAGGLRNVARSRLARSRLDAGDFDGAIEVAMELPEVDGHRPRDVEWVMAEAYVGLGNEDKALEIARGWLKVSQKFAPPNLIVGRHLFQQGDYDAALPHLEVARGSSVTSEAAELYIQCLLKLQRFDRATALLEQRLEGRASDWQAFLLKVQAMEGMGWIDDARAELTRALGGNFSRPGSEANRQLRAYMDAFIERHDLLPRDLHTAQVLWTDDPANFDFGRRYLDLLLDAGAVEQAHRVADDLVSRCPLDDNAHYEVMMSAGRAYERLGRHERAVACLIGAQKDRPWSVEAHVAVARNELALDNMGGAWRAIEKAELLEPEDVELALVRFHALEARGERKEAIAAGAHLVEQNVRSYEFVTELARLLLAEGLRTEALRLLAVVSAEELQSPERRIEHALLTLAAGGEDDARQRIESVVKSERYGTSRVLDISRRLAEIGRNDLVIELLEPRVAGDAEIDPAAVEILASAYRASGADEPFLRMLSRLRRQGRRGMSHTWAAEFTSAKGATAETLSIIEGAVAEGATTERLLEIGTRTAIAAGRLDLAAGFLREFRKLPDTGGKTRIRLKAALTDAEGDYVEAVSILETAIENSLPHERSGLWTDLIELHGRHGQLEALQKAATTALSRQECPAGMALRAARFVLEAGAANATVAVDAGIAVAPDQPDGYLDKGLLLVGKGRPGEAIAEFEKAFALRADGSIGHALAVALAIGGDGDACQRFLGRQQEILGQDTVAMARFILYLRQNKTTVAIDWLDRLEHPSWAERQSIGELVTGVAGVPEKQAFIVDRLPRFMLLMSFEQSIDLAKAIANEIESTLPEYGRQVRLLRARALMTDPESYNDGIRIVAKILNESDMSDEAAVSIYAEAYLKAERWGDLERLIRYLLERNASRDGFLLDLAAKLLAVDRAEDAAKLVFLCKNRDDRVMRAQARALFKAGVLDRAAAILDGLQSREQRDFLYCQIMGEYLSGDPKRQREGLELLKEAVYRFPIEDADVHVALARAAYRLGERAEARKNIERYLSSAPASARNVVVAFAVINEVDQADVDTLAYLQDRRALLDPMGHFSIN
ncbi:MAG: tetratricopeptide repeat protein [Planctomycetes bacterium]|nr:tetratricopeptide repeat protein [Planctomycetota bacterium]